MIALVSYAGRRAVRGVVIFCGVSLGAFILNELAPGDFYSEARLNPRISPQTLLALKAEHGTNLPVIRKYGNWLDSVARGDWGFSLSYNVPVESLLWSRVFNTFILTVTGTVLAWLIAVPVGIWLATTGRVRSRLLGHGGVALLLATPELLVVLILQFLAARTRLLPVGGMFSVGLSQTGPWTATLDLARHAAIPVTALVLAALPVLITHSASAIAEVMETPFIRGARANGIPRWRLLFRHGLPVASPPLIALFGFAVGTLLSASVLVENAIGWPGLGGLMLEATLQRDEDVVVAIVTLSAIFLIAGNFLADLLLFAVDPRIRRE